MKDQARSKEWSRLEKLANKFSSKKASSSGRVVTNEELKALLGIG
jgi:hypothetical protein